LRILRQVESCLDNPVYLELGFLFISLPGKALLLMNHKLDKKEVTKTQWTERFCSHTVKNIFSRRAIWQGHWFYSSLS